MKLQYLEIGNEWVALDDLKGKAKFVGSTGAVQINLDDTACKRILSVLAEELVRQTKELSKNLTTEIIEAQANDLLENREDDTNSTLL